MVEILSTEVGNEDVETNEQLVCCWQRITTLGTPTATTTTPAPNEPSDQAASSTVKANVTGSEPTYPATTQDADIPSAFGMRGFASLDGYAFFPPPEERPYIKGQASMGLRLLNAPGGAVDLTVKIVFREVG